MEPVRATALAIVATTALSCTYGGGPTIAVSRHRVTIGVQGGAGPGSRAGGLRLDLAAGVGIDTRHGDESAYRAIGGTGILLGNDHHALTTGGALVTGGYSNDGGFFGLGAMAAWFDGPFTFARDGDRDGWSVALMLRTVGGRFELMLLPQRTGYTEPPQPFSH
jgi:hypothetical protein